MSGARSRRDELAAALAAVQLQDRARLRRRRTRPRRGHAHRRDEVLPGLRRAPAPRPRGAALRREPRPGGGGEVRRGARRAGGRRRHGLLLHFIGQLQTNKAGHVASYADVVQSVDRPRLVSALDRGAHAAGRRLDVLLQVDLDPDPRPRRFRRARGGVRPEDAAGLADAVAVRDLLRLRGVMAVAPLGGDPDAAFARLREVADGIRERHPGADWISAGMSGDLEAAVRHGATHLRVGTAILGSRPSLL